MLVGRLTSGRKMKLSADSLSRSVIDRVVVPAREERRGEEEERVDQAADDELQGEDDVVVDLVDRLRPHQGLPHAAAGDEAGQAGEDLDGEQQAEDLGRQQPGQHDAEGEAEDLVAGLAGKDPGGAAAHRVALAHVAPWFRRSLRPSGRDRPSRLSARYAMPAAASNSPVPRASCRRCCRAASCAAACGGCRCRRRRGGGCETGSRHGD